MDALARLEPVARPLLAEVDAALATLGAPPEHPLWPLLRQLATTPADVVAAVAELRAQPLHAAADGLRDQAATYRAAVLPIDVSWSGAAGEAYRVHVGALAAHLDVPAAVPVGDGTQIPTGGGARIPTGVDPQATMVGRLEASAEFLDQTAGWFGRARHRVAVALAEVLASGQALRLRAGPIRGGGFTVPTRAADGAAHGAAHECVVAAADIGAWVLAAAGEALAEGRDLHDRFTAELGELDFHAPVAPPGRLDATLRLIH